MVPEMFPHLSESGSPPGAGIKFCVHGLAIEDFCYTLGLQATKRAENCCVFQAADEERYDLVREGVIIFMGALAKHLSLV